MWHPFANEEDGLWNRPHIFFCGVDVFPLVNPCYPDIA